MILLSYEQRERLIRASSKWKETPKENLDDVIDDLIMRSPYAFNQKTVEAFKRRQNMSRYHGFAIID
jgi:hypothetical protein